MYQGMTQCIPNLLNISKAPEKPNPRRLHFLEHFFLMQFLETENYEFDIPVLLLRHTLCHILFLPCKTHADFAEGLTFCKPSPSVEMHTFSTESVLCPWSLSKASTKPAAWNFLSFRWLEEEEKSSEVALVLPRKPVFSAPRDFVFCMWDKQTEKTVSSCSPFF